MKTYDAGWICSFASGDLRPCHAPADWIVRRGELSVGACHLHLAEITESLTPRIEVLSIAEAVAQAAKTT